jgi:hypothetical protein
MSIEIHVLSDQRLPSIAMWQEAIESEDFALKLKLSRDTQFDEVSGFLPALLTDMESGFECYHDDARELMEAYANSVEFDHVWKHALSFQWGSIMRESVSAYMAATAYARATGGVVFDPQDAKIMTPAESRDVVHQLEKHV